MSIYSDPNKWIKWFDAVDMRDVPQVGGKNASLGEMYQKLTKFNIPIPYGFATTANAYRFFLEENELSDKLRELLSDLNTHDVENLMKRGAAIRKAIVAAELPGQFVLEIAKAYKVLSARYRKRNLSVAVRSSATAEDLPGASFAGQQETFLNIVGPENLAEAVKKCYASLFTNRAISYRVDKGFDHMSVAISVGVQKMVRSDLSVAGVMFTAEAESGFNDAIVIHSNYGLGESVVKGRVTPDEFVIFQPGLKDGHKGIIQRRLGTKEEKVVYSTKGKDPTKTAEVPKKHQTEFTLTDSEILQLAWWGVKIEEHYKMPMDIEWAKDGESGRLYIVQARPMTGEWLEEEEFRTTIYSVKAKKKPIVEGFAVGRKVEIGDVIKIKEANELKKFREGGVLVTKMTDPDWEPVMKIASAIVTDEGGKTCHAAIVSRELGIPCIVGTGKATKKLKNGSTITVSCAEGEVGKVYSGKVKISRRNISLKTVPKIKTDVMLNIGDPKISLSKHKLPTAGVGLARIEFILANQVKIHPLAAINFEEQTPEIKSKIKEVCGCEKPKDYFVRVLSEGIGKIAASVHPKDVIVRCSDFKTNEYRQLIGGELYEPMESNPMIGWRGASRYADEKFRKAFDLECKALWTVRHEMGLENVYVMVPFCRTPEELKEVIKIFNENGLRRGRKGLKIYVMAEVPTNIILAKEFAELVDGFSIGTNDLTQLTFGIDRDSQKLADLWDDTGIAIKRSISELIKVAHKHKKVVGICGEAPSNDLTFAKWLVKEGIDSISLESDSIIPFLLKMKKE